MPWPQWPTLCSQSPTYCTNAGHRWLNVCLEAYPLGRLSITWYAPKHILHIEHPALPTGARSGHMIAPKFDHLVGNKLRQLLPHMHTFLLPGGALNPSLQQTAHHTALILVAQRIARLVT